MTVAELKAVVDKMPQDAEVRICTNTPPGWMCPDGAAVGVRLVTQGRDWHMGEVLMVPKCSLDIHNVPAWSSRRDETEQERKACT